MRRFGANPRVMIGMMQLATAFLAPALSPAPAPSRADVRANLSPGDTVAVVGASGNVGKLVALRLADTYNVRGIVRDASRVRAFLPAEKVQLYEADICSPDAQDRLAAALDGAHGLVVCTGTTAFPTKAWSSSGDDGVGVAVTVARTLFDARGNRRAAIAALDAQGLNTPVNVDERGTRAILDAWARAAGDKRKRCVLMSSIGVDRRKDMPFPILNACGVLDAKVRARPATGPARARRDLRVWRRRRPRRRCDRTRRRAGTTTQ